VRFGQLARAGNGLGAAKSGEKRPRILQGKFADELNTFLALRDDWTVRDLAAALKTKDIQISHDSVWRYMRREGLTFKKNPSGQRARSPQSGASAQTMESRCAALFSSPL
jgi:transposase